MKPTPDPRPGDPSGLSVLILASTGRDAELCARTLSDHGMSCDICRSAAEMIDRIEAGRGPAVFAVEDLEADDAKRLEQVLESQPDWSDMPLVILSRPAGPPFWLEAVAGLPSSAVLHRPIKSDTFVTVARAAVQSRLRQHRVRDLLRRLQTRGKQLQSLAVELTEAEDRERRRIAEILHDDLQQILVGVEFNLGALAGQDQADGSTEILDGLSDMLQEAIRKTRELSHQLSPPVLWESGLLGALEWLGQRMEHMHGLTVDVQLPGGAEPSATALQPFLFRCAQELLFNVAKHAQTDRAELHLFNENGEIRLRVRDRGCGFAPEALGDSEGGAGFGLFTIRERTDWLGGRLVIDSRPGAGSTFTVLVPCEVSEADEPGRYTPNASGAGAAPGHQRPR